MRADTVLRALDLPEDCCVGTRVPKTVLLEKANLTAADRRRLQEDVEALRWDAAIKPNVVAIPAHEPADGSRRAPEILVMTLGLRPGCRSAQGNELIHRAFPYPLVLLTELGAGLTVSMALKRMSQSHGATTVLDGGVLAAEVGDAEIDQDFLHSLPLGRQPQADLFTVYTGWLDCAVALAAAKVTTNFRLAGSWETTQRRWSGLAQVSRLEGELARLRTQAKKERQIARRVRLNESIGEAQEALKRAQEKL